MQVFPAYQGHAEFDAKIVDGSDSPEASIDQIIYRLTQNERKFSASRRFPGSNSGTSSFSSPPSSSFSNSSNSVVSSNPSGNKAANPDSVTSEPAAPSVDFAVGDTCYHESFGPGIILGFEGEGPRKIANIDFEQTGSKRLVLSLAGLRKL